MVHLFSDCVTVTSDTVCSGMGGGPLKIIFPIFPIFKIKKLIRNLVQTSEEHGVCVYVCVDRGSLFPSIFMVSQLRIVIYGKSCTKENVEFNKWQVG